MECMDNLKSRELDLVGRIQSQVQPAMIRVDWEGYWLPDAFRQELEVLRQDWEGGWKDSDV